MSRLLSAFGLWLFLSAVWILFCLYSRTDAGNIGYDPASAMEATYKLAFTPPALALFGLVSWLLFSIFRLVSQVLFGMLKRLAHGPRGSEPPPQ
jgi:hypothetical protein